MIRTALIAGVQFRFTSEETEKAYMALVDANDEAFLRVHRNMLRLGGKRYVELSYFPNETIRFGWVACGMVGGLVLRDGTWSSDS